MSNKDKDYGLKTFCPDETVFFRTHSQKGRLEISFALGEDFKKIKWLFQELVSGEDGRMKQGAAIEFYCDPDDLIGGFVHYIKNGRFGMIAANDIKKALSSNKASYGVTLWSSNRGTEGKRGEHAEYREIKLQRSTYYDKDKTKNKVPHFLLSAMVCDGYVKDMGGGKKLILPVQDSNGKPQNVDRVAFMLTYEQLVSMAYAIEREIDSYRTSQYVMADIRRLISGASASTPTKDAPAKEEKKTVKKSSKKTKETEAVTIDINTGEVVDEVSFDDLPY